MGVPYSIFCCFKSTTEARLIDLEAGGGGGGTYSTDVNTMLASADNAGIRTSIGLGITSSPALRGVTFTDAAPAYQTTTVAGQTGFNFLYSGQLRAQVSDYGLQFTNYGQITWASGSSNFNITKDTSLERDTTGTLAQRLLSQSQTFRLYNGTDGGTGNPTNFDRASFSFTSGNFRIAAEYSNTGAYTTARGIDFATNGVVRMSIAAAGLVGIGTNTPASGLHISGALGTNAITYDSAAALKLTNTTDGSSWMLTPGIVGVLNGSFSIRNAGSSLTALAISNTGGVGIGLNSLPGAKLHITGGDQSTSFSAATIALSLGATGTFPHFIHTRHNNVLNNNAIDFYTGDGNAGGVFPTNAIHGLTINNGSVGVGTTFPVADLDIAKTWNAPALAVTGASGTGTTATLTFAAQTNPIALGSTIVVAGITPAGYNGTFVVTASSLTSVAYANATVTTVGAGGTIERVFTSVKLNVTDTASNAASNLMDLQVGGVSKFDVSKAGVVKINNGGTLTWTSADSLVFGSTSGYQRVLSYSLYASNLLAGMGDVAGQGGCQLYLGSGSGLGWASGTTIGTGIDTMIFRDGAAGILAQRNLGFTQAFRLYNATSATPLTDWDRASLSFTSGNFRIAAENSGTTGYNTARGIDFVTGGVVRMSISAAGLVGIGAISSQALTIAGSTYMTGATGALRIGSGFNLGISRSGNNLTLDAPGGIISATTSLTVTNGDAEVATIASGLILKSPDGTRYRVTAANGGTLSVAAV